MGTFPRATFFCPTSIPLPHLHTGLSKVENMITPADLARMLGQTPDSADSHTQDHLLYTSETPHHSADSGDSSDVGGTASHSTNQAVHQDEVDAVPTAQHSGVPGTPATPATPEPSESEISDAASDMPAPKPMMPTPATVFGMHATVTIATTSGTIEGQADGIAGEAGAETIAEVEPIIATAQTSVTIVTNDPAATAHAAVDAAVAVAKAAAAHTTAITDSARRADAACGTYRTGRNAGHHAGLSAVCSTSEARNVSASHAGHGLRPAPVRRCCLAGTGSAGRTGDAIRPDSGHDAATPYVGRSDHIRFTGCPGTAGRTRYRQAV